MLDASISDMSLLCEPRAENIAEIVIGWKRLTDREPWRSLPNSEWVDHFPPLLNADESLSEIVRFDAAATFAAMGSLRGYHRREIERERDWNGEVARIVADWEQTSLTDDEKASTA
jgi:hypothetical protein